MKKQATTVTTKFVTVTAPILVNLGIQASFFQWLVLKLVLWLLCFKNKSSISQESSNKLLKLYQIVDSVQEKKLLYEMTSSVDIFSQLSKLIKESDDPDLMIVNSHLRDHAVLLVGDNNGDRKCEFIAM